MANTSISLLEAFEELANPRARACAYQLKELLLETSASLTARPNFAPATPATVLAVQSYRCAFRSKLRPLATLCRGLCTFISVLSRFKLCDISIEPKLICIAHPTLVCLLALAQSH